MRRPAIQIELEPVDKILEFVALAGLLAMTVHSVASYGHLPERIPVHFNAAGEADGFGGKAMIWLLPAIGLASWLLMTLTSRYPQKFNYTVKITAENAHQQYEAAVRMVRMLKAAMMVLFAYINYGMIQVAFGKMEGLGVFFLPIFLLVVFLPIGYYWWKSSQKTDRDVR